MSTRVTVAYKRYRKLATVLVISVPLWLAGVFLRSATRGSCTASLKHGAVAPADESDSSFAVSMIAHHQGAIDMARGELRDGRNEQLRRLAQEIIITQQQEIAVLRLVISSSTAQTNRQDR